MFDLIIKAGTCLVPHRRTSKIYGKAPYGGGCENESHTGGAGKVKEGHVPLIGPLTQVTADVGIRGGWITQVGSIDSHLGEQVFDAQGLHILPGLMDTQVHFREPGLEHKEDLFSGTRAAILGGITAVFEMPNTLPPTITVEQFKNKVGRAQGRCWSHYAFYAGATPDNGEQLLELEKLPGCCGIKIFMGSSTGNLLVKDSEALDRILALGKRRVAIHAEDEARLQERSPLLQSQKGNPAFHPQWRDEEVALRATQCLLKLATKHQRSVHVLHVSTAQEMKLLKSYKENHREALHRGVHKEVPCGEAHKENYLSKSPSPKNILSVECTPQHLTLVAPHCYEKWGTWAQMNPPIRGVCHQDALWEGIYNGTVDIIGSDHAPHTKEEKARTYPLSPSGMPGVQTIVPIMLNHVGHGRLSLEKLVELMCVNPVNLFGVQHKGAIQEGYHADFTIIDLNKEAKISEDWLRYKCGWSPFSGELVKGWPVATLLKGNVVMKDGKLTGQEPCGELLSFEEPLG